MHTIESWTMLVESCICLGLLWVCSLIGLAWCANKAAHSLAGAVLLYANHT
ncbi:hypothetical protein Gotur_010399 [Gossypium turneri]